VGLHAADVHKLIEVLQRLVDAGNSVLIIEHNLDIIKVADYIIDLGPEGGDRGGEIVVEGTPEQVCESENSYTGEHLRPFICVGPVVRR
jgi:excinuclease ABC subunit A